MKRYTKKGPRRSRAMPVSSKRFVVTDYDGCSYITAGKAYAAKFCSASLMEIPYRGGENIVIASPAASFGCSHINENKWRWVTL